MSQRHLICLHLLLAALAVSLTAVAACQHAENPGSLALERELKAQSRPMAIFVVGVDGSSAAATGLADTDTDRAMTVDTPVRVASVTKTLVAATVLRLWEQQRIALDAPIDSLLTPKLDRMLRGDGFDTRLITVRHLLSHTAGLDSYSSDDRFRAAVLAEPRRIWTPEDQVRLTMEYADPLGAPGKAFHYSDTGYVLLGDVIVRLTGLNLATAVRRELRLTRLPLNATWWETLEAAPLSAGPRARQYVDEVELTNVHPSIDLYGSGGLVMSARDIAIFFSALFSGRIYDRPETLQEMLRPGHHDGADRYRLGIFAKRVGDQDLYCHGGVWGIMACYSPSTSTAVAGVTTHRDAYDALIELVQATALRPAAQRDR